MGGDPPSVEQTGPGQDERAEAQTDDGGTVVVRRRERREQRLRWRRAPGGRQPGTITVPAASSASRRCGGSTSIPAEVVSGPGSAATASTVCAGTSGWTGPNTRAGTDASNIGRSCPNTTATVSRSRTILAPLGRRPR
ncbi:hypothetical protein [Frankia sp. QA3]|uniref:hypothetical protein n=1 Tax=Frankia sp. QA3 TaxID=710111 RepID=UPI001E57F02A|nr:hypothetical protein [Frankia sp. QA3]